LNDKNLNIPYLVHKLLSGKNIFVYKNTNYYQKNSSLDIKIEADFLYKETYESNLFNDSFISQNQITAILIENKIIPFDYDAQVKKLEKKIEDVKIDLYKHFKNKNLKKTYKKQIELHRKSINSLLEKIHSLDFLLLENFCNKIKLEYILSNTIYYKQNNQLVFDFYNLNYILFNNIANYIYDDELNSLDTLKIIARDPYWKNYWTANKTSLFQEPTQNWSDQQRALVNLSNMYDSVYESMECPDEDIIDDNDALDGWFIFQKRKRLLEKKEKGVDQLLGKGKNSGEVFLIASSTEDIEEITEMNSEESLQIYRSRIQATRSSDRPIHEAEFPDVKGKLIQELKGMQK
jgi:hypothetical protein